MTERQTCTWVSDELKVNPCLDIYVHSCQCIGLTIMHEPMEVHEIWWKLKKTIRMLLMRSWFVVGMIVGVKKKPHPTSKQTWIDNIHHSLVCSFIFKLMSHPGLIWPHWHPILQNVSNVTHEWIGLMHLFIENKGCLYAFAYEMKT